MKKIQVIIICMLFLTMPVWADIATIDGADVEDTDIHGGLAGSSFGGRGEMRVDDNSNIHMLVRFKNLSSAIPAGSVVTAALCSLYCFDDRSNRDGNVSTYEIFKPWVEGTHQFVDCTNGSSYEDWDCDQAEWGSNGGNCAQDDGIDNTDSSGTCTAADSTADRTSTAMSTTNVTSIGWWTWSIDTDLVQAWVDGTRNEEGFIFIGDALEDVDKLFFTSDSTEVSNLPRLIVTYTPPATGQKVMIRK